MYVSIVCFLIVRVLLKEVSSDDSSSTNNDFAQSTRIIPSAKTVKFYSYSNKANPTAGSEIKIGNVKSLERAGLEAGKKIRIIVHGFKPNVTMTSEACRILVPEYLAKGTANLICVDWAKLAGYDIPSPIDYLFYIKILRFNVPQVGRKIAELIRFLLKSQIISDPNMVHILGHSLGAHVGGIAGAQVQKSTGKKVGRITGLDPAGPFLELAGRNGKLKKSDASFVDVLHTDSTFLGSTLSFGHVDFFANGGRSEDQPACQLTISGLGFNSLGCGHPLALNYYQRTISGEVFVGCKCMKSRFELFKPTCAKPRDLSCKRPARFGEYGLETARGNYYLDVPDTEQ